jgi:hypothetical protein
MAAALMEMETAVRRYLLDHPLSAGAVGRRIYKRRLVETVEGTGLAAIVVDRGPGWATPDAVQSPEFPRLLLDVHADPSRAAGGEIAADDAIDKALGVHRAVKPMFVFPQLRGMRIGGFGSRLGLLVVRCQRYTEPRLLTPHQAQQGDTVAVRCEYALELAHDGS